MALAGYLAVSVVNRSHERTDRRMDDKKLSLAYALGEKEIAAAEAQCW